LSDLKGAIKISSRFGGKSSRLIHLAGGSSSIKRLEKLSDVKPKSILYASTYGERGLDGLKLLGEAKFMARVSKTAYKGNLDSLFNLLLNLIPDNILFGVIAFGTIFFLIKI